MSPKELAEQRIKMIQETQKSYGPQLFDEMGPIISAAQAMAEAISKFYNPSYFDVIRVNVGLRESLAKWNGEDVT